MFRGKLTYVLYNILISIIAAVCAVEGQVLVYTVNGTKRYSSELPQGGLPCEYRFTDLNDVDLFKETKRRLEKIECSVTSSAHDSERD